MRWRSRSEKWRCAASAIGGIFGGGLCPAGHISRRSRFWRRRAAATGAQQKQERGLNENYGREVMELHTVGVDAGYTQNDVIEMAKILTGWTIREPRKDPEFFFNERIHAPGQESGDGPHVSITAAMKDGEEALKMLANDPAHARTLFPPNSRAILFRTIRRKPLSIAWRRITKQPAAIFAAV